MNYSDNLQSLWKEAKTYLELQKEYLALDTAEKLSVLLSAVATATVCLMLGMVALFFLLFALAAWIGHLAGNAMLGYLLMGVLLLLAMVIVYAGRKRWIIQPLTRLVASLFIHDEEEEQQP